MEAQCPICGKSYSIPEGRGREMVVTKYLRHKDSCQLPAEDEFVKIGGRVGIVVEVRPGSGPYPTFEVQMPSGKTDVIRASDLTRIADQEQGRKTFYE